MTVRIAIVGTGQMGRGMALALDRAGFDIIGYDASLQSRDAAAAQGLAVAASLRQAVHDRDFILTSLPNSAIMREVWLGDSGILASGPREAATCIDLSTIDATTMQAVEAACRQRSLAVIDAPVSGGPAEAALGNLVLMIGGTDDDVAGAKPVLNALGGVQLHTGAVGTAKTVKLVNNVMTMGNVLVAAEAFALGTAAGVEPQALFDALSQSGGRSHHFVKRFPNAIRSNWEPGFKMELGEKDLALALDVAHSFRQPMPVASLIREMMNIALGQGYAEQDIVALLDMYQTMNRSR